MEEKLKMENLEKLKKKNFLVIGSDFYLSLEKSYLRAFKNLKINNVDFFSPDKKLALKILSRFNNTIIKKIYFLMYRKAVKNFISKDKKYDYIIIFKGLQLDLAYLNAYKEYQKSAKWINIYTDNPFNLEFASCSNHEVLNSVKFYDFFCTSFSKILNFKLKKLKVKKNIFLPFGYDKYLHRKPNLKKKTNTNNKINFVGAYDKYRENFLNKLNIKIDVFGPGWNKMKKKNKNINISSGMIDGIKLSKINNEYSISLNIMRKQDLNSHNMKTFEIPAMNGLLLTRRNTEQNTLFEENVFCYMYKDYKELRKKIKDILNDSAKANIIRKAAHNKVRQFSYENRLKFLLSNLL